MTEPSDYEPTLDDDEQMLLASLHDLGSMVTGSLGLTELVGNVATFATRAIPGAKGAGVTLLRDRDEEHPIEALAASAPFVAEIDRLQYEKLNEGPCITAVRERRCVRTGSLADEPMWPRFGPQAERCGVHSALSLPLMLGDRVVGAINAYAFDKDAFDDHAVELGELFAAPAAVAVHNAQILHQANDLVGRLRTAIAARPVVDQAVGIIRARAGVSSEVAFARLRDKSQQEKVPVVEVAQRVVDDAIRRVKAPGGGRDEPPARSTWGTTSPS